MEFVEILKEAVLLLTLGSPLALIGLAVAVTFVCRLCKPARF